MLIKMSIQENELRRFETWATRDTSKWKLQTSKYSHPLCDYSFNTYMLSKQFINWEWREWDNWQKWIPPSSLYESLCRHIEELKLLTYWFEVFESRKDWIVTTSLTKPEWEDYVQKDVIETLNAIRFNTEALKLHYLNSNLQHETS